MTAVDEPVDVAGLVAADGDRGRYWQRVYATLRAYPGLRPDDRVSRCGRCRNWVIHPEDHGGRAVMIPRPWNRCGEHTNAHGHFDVDAVYGSFKEVLHN